MPPGASEFWKAYLSDGSHSTYTFKRPVDQYAATSAIEDLENRKLKKREPNNPTTIKVTHIKEG